MSVVDRVERRNWLASLTCKFCCFFFLFLFFVFFEFMKSVVKVRNVFLSPGGNGTLSWSPTRSLARPVSLMDL